jgi:catechol 2,3-dioxygenase-like lactoylglutathione lyase family enzyme
MIDHIGLKVSDPVLSRRFYDNALAPLGYQMMMQIPLEHTGGAAVFGYGVPPKPDFWVHEGIPENPEVHVAFRAASHQQVDDFYRAALAAGGKCNGAPGPRLHYHENYYGAFVLDPDGHNVEAVCHEPVLT